MTNYTHVNTPAGRLLLAADEVGLRKVLFGGEPRSEWQENAVALQPAVNQLRAYFEGTLRHFDLPLAPEGTAFQRRVWQELCRIPYGQTLSYGELASRLGNPNASRAVGLANGANPIAIIIPCHRVVGANGKLVGYGGGLPKKELLLTLERSSLQGFQHSMFAGTALAGDLESEG